jgi:hypothetical protein
MWGNKSPTPPCSAASCGVLNQRKFNKNVNEKEAGSRPYGYIPFFVNANDFLNYGDENTIRVVADNSQLPNSRWYPGSGIYRPVWLCVGCVRENGNYGEGCGWK